MSGDCPRHAYSPFLFNNYTITFEGNSVSCILYGVYLVIAGTNLHLLHKKPSNQYKILSWFTILQLALTTLYFVFSLYAGPGQALAIFNIGNSFSPDALSPFPIVIVDTAFVLNTWASDGFLLYRCYVVYMGNRYALAVPVSLYVATFGVSIALLVESSIPGAVYSTPGVQVAGICFWICSAALNVCASLLISIRFWLYRRTLMRAIGSESRRDGFYLGYMAITLESALLYTVFVIIALVVFALNSPLETMFFPVLSTVQVIAPSLIIYRIARGMSPGTEWGTDVMSSLRFSVLAGTRPRSVARSVHFNLDSVDGSGGTADASPGEHVGLDTSVQQPAKEASEV